MKTTRQEQFRTGTCSVQRLHSWVTAKVLMLLVMLMVSVQGAWAQSTLTKDGVIYTIINGNTLSVSAIENGVTDVFIPCEITDNGNQYKVTNVEWTGVFKNKTNLRSVKFERNEDSTNSITSIVGGFNGCSNLESVTLPNTLKVMEKDYFRGSSKLTSVIIPEELKEISEYAFYGCSSLSTVAIQEGVTKIGNNAFQGCTSLRYVEIPNSVTILGAIEANMTGEVFSGCTALQSVKLSSNITVIPTRTFYGCTSLASINIPEGITQIGADAFAGCPLSTLNIPASLSGDGLQYAFLAAVPTLTSITVATGNPTYDSRENCNALIKTSTNDLVLGCRNTVIPDNVNVTNYSFNRCTGLTTLTLPKSCKINLESFRGCSNLTTIYCKATDPTKIVFSGTRQADSPNFKAMDVYVPSLSVDLYKNNTWFREVFDVNKIVADPATVKQNYISDVDFGVVLQNDYTLATELTRSHHKLGYNTTTSIFDGVTGIIFVKIENNENSSDFGDLKEEYIIDGKSYKRASSLPAQGSRVVGDQLQRKYYCPYITRDGNNVSGTNILTELQIFTSAEPLDDPDFVKGVETNTYGDAFTFIDNQDWAEGDIYSESSHTYRYVKATYKIFQSPVDEIHYTTTDNTKIDIASGAFGANVFQSENHTYKNGVGVIKFDNAVEGTLAASVFAGNTKVQNVMLPPGITEIANGAFEGCTALQNISISEDLRSIGTSAFKGCSSLLAVSLPNGLKTLGDGAFEGCSSLTDANVPRNITVLGANMFKDCTALEAVVLPEGTTAIGTSAFEGCTGLIRINDTTLKNLSTIGSRSFYGCTALAEVKFWDITKSNDNIDEFTTCEIGTQAFAGCTSLKDVYMQKVGQVNAKAFDGCTNMYSFNVEKYSGEMSDIADDAFPKSVISVINLNGTDHITTIPDNKFKEYRNLSSFTFPKNLVSIGAYAFAFTALRELCISDLTSLTDIGEGAFYDCEQIRNIVLPESVIAIKAHTFTACINLKSIYFKNTLETIGEKAFYSCSQLKTVMFGTGLKSIGAQAFGNCGVLTEISANLSYDGVYATNTNCFDNDCYTHAEFVMVGDNAGDENIYGKAPWSSFKNKTTSSDFCFVDDQGSIYRLYPDNYETVDGRRIRGAVLISGKKNEYPAVVNTDYPVVAFASGSIGAITGTLTIPGNIVRLEEGFISSWASLDYVNFSSSDEILYVDKTLKFKDLKIITIDRDIKCLNGGLFEGLQSSRENFELRIGKTTSYLSANCFRNSNLKNIRFSSEQLFGFENGAFAGCKQIRYILVEVNSESKGMDETRCSHNTFELDVIRNASMDVYGSQKQVEQYQSSEPWINFYEPDQKEVTVDGATYKIYPRLSYSYNIKEDFGVHNITGAVLTGGSFSGEVVIPDKVAGFPVIAITKGRFNENSNVTSISFPGTLRMIENNAVEKMENLKKVEFRDQMFPRDEKCYIGYAVYSVIDEEAFYKCDALEEVSIGCNIDWEGSEDEPFEDRDNLKTVRITKGCHQIGKDGDHSNDRLFNTVWTIDSIIIEDSDEPLEIYGNHEEESFVFDMLLHLKYCYMGRDCKNTSMGRLFWWDNKTTTTSVLEIGPKVTEFNQHIKIGKTLRFSEGNILKTIAAGVFSGSSSYVVEGYCPNLEVIEDYAFNNNKFKRCFWFDPRHPEESHLRKIGNCAINKSELNVLYLPPTMESVGEKNGYTIKNVYIYSEDLSKLKIDPKFVRYEGDTDKNFSSEITFHFLCSHNGDPGKYKTDYWDDQNMSIDDYHNKFDIHSWKTKKGVIQSSGLYSEVCAGCGGDDNRSESTGNYFISNWNGSEDLKVHKDGSTYSYAGPLAIDDSKPFQSPVNFSAESVTYNRTVTGGRVATFVLPFASNASDVNGTVYKFREFSGDKFCFDEQTGALDANTPYLVVVDEEATQLLNDVTARSLAATVSNTLSPLACNVTGSDEMAQHVGSFVQQPLTDGDNGKSYYGYASTDGAFVKAQEAQLNPFRTMFTLPLSAQVKRITLQLGDDEEDAIIGVDADLLDGEGSPMYDLNGVRIAKPVRGQVYIQNGQKVIGK